MAKKRKKRSSGKKIRFQLTTGGIIGIGIVCFCLFMWMFLLGIWAGQTILLPSAPAEKTKTLKTSTGEQEQPPIQILGPEGKKKLVH